MRAHVLRNTLISILVALFSITATSCGKTSRLERLERERAEIAAEQARVDKLGKQKGVWERFSNNTWTYVIGTAAVVAVVVGVGALIYHRHKKAGIPPTGENPNGQQAEVQQEEAHQVPQPEHLEENAQFPPPPAQEQNHIDNIPAQEAQNQIMQPQAENVPQLQIQQINEHQEVVAQMQHEAPPAENIQEPEIHNDGLQNQLIFDEPPAQNPQQNLEVANNAAIPQQDIQQPPAQQLVEGNQQHQDQPIMQAENQEGIGDEAPQLILEEEEQNEPEFNNEEEQQQDVIIMHPELQHQWWDPINHQWWQWDAAQEQVWNAALMAAEQNWIEIQQQWAILNALDTVEQHQLQAHQIEEQQHLDALQRAPQRKA